MFEAKELLDINVLHNARRFLAEDFDIFLVANDKYNLYPHLN